MANTTFPISSWIRALVVAGVATALLWSVHSLEIAVAAAGLCVLCWGLRIEADARRSRARGPVAPQELAGAGLGPLPVDRDARELYLDLVKRSVINIPYHESSGTFAHIDPATDKFAFIPAMQIDTRMRGEDFAYNKLTMIGWQRLDNIQSCIETLVKDRVPGDLIETGSAKGGACIVMKAVLRATEDPAAQPARRVFACDTFMPYPHPPYVIGYVISEPVLFVLQLLASIPFKPWQRAFYRGISRIQKSFPAAEEPSEKVVQAFLHIARKLRVYRKQAAIPKTGAEVRHIESHFARFGLLDENVIFLKGFFSETLPTAPIERLALLRADADTYESTMDGLRPLYPKLSPGGFCIIDDDHSFPDCRRAVDEYRAEQGITEPLERIDKHAVFWRKAFAQNAPG